MGEVNRIDIRGGPGVVKQATGRLQVEMGGDVRGGPWVVKWRNIDEFDAGGGRGSRR